MLAAMVRGAGFGLIVIVLAASCGGAPAAQRPVPPTVSSAESGGADPSAKAAQTTAEPVSNRDAAGSNSDDTMSSVGGPDLMHGLQVQVTEVKVTGSASDSLTRRYIERTTQKLIDCYTSNAAGGTKRATAQVAFDIQSDGHVANPNISGVDSTIAGCVSGVIGAIAFQQPAEGKPVHVTLQLESGIPQ
jgi:hypothetical protein